MIRSNRMDFDGLYIDASGFFVDGVEITPGSGTPSWDDITDKPTTFAATPASVEAAVADKTEVAALTAIADPSAADAEACATAINAIIAALQA
jgi:hypothetical protein